MWRLLALIPISGHWTKHPRQTERSPTIRVCELWAGRRDSSMAAPPQDRSSARATQHNQPTEGHHHPAYPLAAPRAPVSVLSCPEQVLPRSSHRGVVQLQGRGGVKQIIMREYLVSPFQPFIYYVRMACWGVVRHRQLMKQVPGIFLAICH